MSFEAQLPPLSKDKKTFPVQLPAIIIESLFVTAVIVLKLPKAPKLIADPSVSFISDLYSPNFAPAKIVVPIIANVLIASP